MSALSLRFSYRTGSNWPFVAQRCFSRKCYNVMRHSCEQDKRGRYMHLNFPKLSWKLFEGWPWSLNPLQINFEDAAQSFMTSKSTSRSKTWEFQHKTYSLFLSEKDRNLFAGCTSWNEMLILTLGSKICDPCFPWSKLLCLGGFKVILGSSRKRTSCILVVLRKKPCIESQFICSCEPSRQNMQFSVSQWDKDYSDSTRAQSKSCLSWHRAEFDFAGKCTAIMWVTSETCILA